MERGTTAPPRRRRRIRRRKAACIECTKLSYFRTFSVGSGKEAPPKRRRPIAKVKDNDYATAKRPQQRDSQTQNQLSLPMDNLNEHNQQAILWLLFTEILESGSSTVGRGSARVQTTYGSKMVVRSPKKVPRYPLKLSRTNGKFNAVYPVSGLELEELLAQGHKLVTKLRRMFFNIGFVLWKIVLRTDSLGCDMEGLYLLFNCAACDRLTVNTGDITNAYFRGKPLV